MKEMKKWFMIATALVAMCATMACNKNNASQPVYGTLEKEIETVDAPSAVYDAMTRVVIDERYETVMDDKTSGVKVLSLLKCNDEVPSEGYGMAVSRGDVMTALPKLRHGNMPRARYDASSGDLWIVGGDMEGTGVRVERPYLLRFDNDGYAGIVTSIDPYEMQQALCKVLSYSIDGQDITFLADGQPLITVTNHIDDMGDIMDDAIYIGEQLEYNIAGPLEVNVTPGVNFTVGKVLHYEDMPTITATVALNDDGTFSLSDFKVSKN